MRLVIRVVLLRLAVIYPTNAMMLTFCRTVFFNRVLTGMVLGLLFKNKSDDDSSTTNTIVNVQSNAAIGKGLLQGSALCGIVLVSTAVWLAGSGLSSRSSPTVIPSREKEDEHQQQHEKPKTD